VRLSRRRASTCSNMTVISRRRVCVDEPPGASRAGDSQWRQWRPISDFTIVSRAGRVFEVPDWYYLSAPTSAAWAIARRTGRYPEPSRRLSSGRTSLTDGAKTPSMVGCSYP
jgi:hypothetical protein